MTKSNKTKKSKKVESLDLTDIYFSTSKRFYKTRLLRKRISEVYNCEELYWTGTLTKDSVLTLKKKDGTVYPDTNLNGAGVTFDGAAKDLFKVENALTIKNGNQVYNYMNKDSKIVFIGKRKSHTYFVRIYDKEPLSNNRWIVISID